MTEHMFGVTRWRIRAATAEKADRIGREVCGKMGGFVQIRDPHDWKGWFTGPNRGDPFDRADAAEVRRLLKEAGIYAEMYGCERCDLHPDHCRCCRCERCDL